MTSERQIAANRQNALKSTGPRTTSGKAIASRNNARHGLRSTTPVIPRLESPAAWQQHRTLTLEGLAPANPLEEALAERVALILWRLGRVTAYERDVTARAREQANEDLSIRRAALLGITDEEALGQVTQARTRFNQARHWLRALASLSRLPEDAPLSHHDAIDILSAFNEQLPDVDVETISAPGIVPVDGQDWTVDRLLRFIRIVADVAGRDAEQLRDETLRAAHRRLNEDRVVYERLAHQLQAVRRQRVLPIPDSVDHLVRYERHLNRQLTQALAQLERVQHARRAAAASAPRPSPRPIGYAIPGLPIDASQPSSPPEADGPARPDGDDLTDDELAALAASFAARHPWPATDVRHSNPSSGSDPSESAGRSR